MDDNHNIKKIIYIASNSISSKTAAVLNIIETCNAFQEKGHEVTLIVPDCGCDHSSILRRNYGIASTFRIIKIKVPHFFLQKKLPGLVTIFSFFSVLKIARFNYDFAITRIPVVYYLLTWLLKKTCIFESHQIRFFGRLQTYIYTYLVKVSTKSKFGLIVCISLKLKSNWVDIGIKESKIFVAHDAVNLSKFSFDLSKIEARKKLGLEKDKKIIVYTGSLLPGKGVDVLVKCSALLPQVQFLIVGGASNDVCKFKKQLSNENITFVGYVDHILIPIYQKAADILVLPNTYGSYIDDVTSPMKLFEYLASQRPIISTNMPSILEILIDNYNALICQTGDASSLAYKISILIDNDQLIEMLIKNALQDLYKYTFAWRSELFIKYINRANMC